MPQLAFDGRDKVQIAIDRIRFHAPLDGSPYWLAFSGGKDSVLILDLTIRAGAPFQAHYSKTGVDPPELYQFIRESHPEVVVHQPERTMWELIARKQMLPTRMKRYCCEWLKERVSRGKGYTIITGIRAQESTSRKHRGMYELCKRDGISHYLNPIIDWTEGEVWDYIRSRNLPYCCLYDEGFKRIGCVLCPISSYPQIDIARWPKIALAYRHACERVWKPGGAFRSAEHYWHWWLARDLSATPDEQMCLMFEDQG